MKNMRLALRAAAVAPETYLYQARAAVRAGEACVARQELVVTRLLMLERDISRAERCLNLFQENLSVLRARLAEVEEFCKPPDCTEA